MHSPLELYQSALKDFEFNHLDLATGKLRDALKIDPAFENAFEALSVIQYHQKKFDESIATIKEWIRVNPHSIMAQTNLSRAYLGKGMILEAEQAQGEARRLTWQAELRGKKKESPATNYKALIDRYKQVIALDPADVLGYFSLGTAYMEADMKRDAADTFEKAVEVNAKHSSSYLGLGQALTALGDKEKAKKIYQSGIKVAETQGDVMTQKKMEAHLRNLESDQKSS